MSHMLHLKYHFIAPKFYSSEFIFGIPLKNRFRYNFGHLNRMWFRLKPLKLHILYSCTATPRRTYSTRLSNTFDGLLLMTCTAKPMPCETILHIGTSHLQSQFQISGVAECIIATCFQIICQWQCRVKGIIAISIWVKQCTSVQYGHGPELNILFVDILSFLLIFYSI